jgi:hypothetical protein
VQAEQEAELATLAKVEAQNQLTEQARQREIADAAAADAARSEREAQQHATELAQQQAALTAERHNW